MSSVTMIVNRSGATGALIFMRGADKAHKGGCATERGIIAHFCEGAPTSA
jgi:hypothetical protein